LVTEYVRFLFLLPSRCGLVAGFGKKKFFRHRGRVALIGRDIFAFGFFRVLPIVQAVTDGRRYGFAFACMARQMYPNALPTSSTSSPRSVIAIREKFPSVRLQNSLASTAPLWKP